MIKLAQVKKDAIRKRLEDANSATWTDFDTGRDENRDPADMLEDFRAGGRVQIEGFSASCGNAELSCLNDHYLPYRSTNAVAYWLIMLREFFQKHHLGNLVASIPCAVKTGKPLKSFTLFQAALKLGEIPRVARSRNPYHPDHYQDLYIISCDEN